MNSFERFKGIFVTPDTTFRDIKETPHKKGLLISFLSVLILCIITTAILLSKITITDYPQSIYIIFIVISLSLIVGFFIVYLIDTLIIWIIGKIFKGSGSFKQISSAFGYVSIFQVIYYIGVLISAILISPRSGKISSNILYQTLFIELFGAPILFIFSILLDILFFIYAYYICRFVHELKPKKAIIIAIILLVTSIVIGLNQIVG